MTPVENQGVPIEQPLRARKHRRRIISHVAVASARYRARASHPAGVHLFSSSQGNSGAELGFFTQLPRPSAAGGECQGDRGTSGCGTGGCRNSNRHNGGIDMSDMGTRRASRPVCGDTRTRAIDCDRRVRIRPSVLQMGAVFDAGRRIALGIMMIPIIARTTEELLDSAGAGAKEHSRWAPRGEATFSGCCCSASRPHQGVILALARIAGETAPLLFTAFNNRFWNTNPLQPTASLTVQIFTYASSPYEDWHRQAWAGALVLVSIVLTCSIVARMATRRLERMNTGS